MSDQTAPVKKAEVSVQINETEAAAAEGAEEKKQAEEDQKTNKNPLLHDDART